MLCQIVSPSTRLRALRDMLENISRVEDIVKVYEARLTEKETTSLSPSEVEDYMSALKVGASCVHKRVCTFNRFNNFAMNFECFLKCGIPIFFFCATEPLEVTVYVSCPGSIEI